MKISVPIRSLLLGVYTVAFSFVVIGCTADQMARVQDGTKKVQDTATIVATAPVPPNPVTDWAGIIAAGAGSLLLVEKALSKYIVPTGVQQAKNVGGSQSTLTTVPNPIPVATVNTNPTIIPPPSASVTESTTVTKSS